MPISYKDGLFKLDAGELTLAFSITNGRLVTRHYGVRLERFEDIPTINAATVRRRTGWHSSPLVNIFDEYPGWNDTIRGTEPALKVNFSDGTRDLRLNYVSHEISGEELSVTLCDETFGLYVKLIYKVFDDCGLIERSAVITNRGSCEAELEIFNSAMLHLPYRDEYRLTSLTGRWSEEYRITREAIRDGQTVLQTRSILSGPDAVPFFAIDEGDATERRGNVWFGTLVWSGTHKLVIEKGVCGDISVSAGINSFDCRIGLKSGEEFTTPPFVFGFTEGGFGKMSRDIHSFERRHIMSETEAKRIMPVVCNAYGTYFGNINEEKILSLIEPAHELGIEALIVDAGWAGEADNYAKGMGEWNENSYRFPHGLRYISDELHKRGMLFGLWMEPECVHIDSKLVHDHPDWVFGYESRGASIEGVRYALNFALDEVRDYITERIISIIESCGVDYFKIDYNRYLFDVGNPVLGREAWEKYVKNLTECYLAVKKRYPELLFENCAGGGMRTDLSMLRFSGRINRSDNQDPLDILKIHEGFSYFMLPKLAGGGCHISDVYTQHHNGRVTPMKYQAEIAMMGSLAVGRNLVELSEDEKVELKSYIERYKSLRHIIHLGDIYRLASANDKPYAAFEYLYGDEGVIFMLGKSQQFMVLPEPLRLEGLEEDALYELEDGGLMSFNPKTPRGVNNSPKSIVMSGRAMMKLGVNIKLEGDFDSRVIRFRKLER